MNFSRLMLLSNYSKLLTLTWNKTYTRLSVPKIHAQGFRGGEDLGSLLSSISIHTTAKGSLDYLSVC